MGNQLVSSFGRKTNTLVLRSWGKIKISSTQAKPKGNNTSIEQLKVA
jgi:hypothetical protein